MSYIAACWHSIFATKNADAYGWFGLAIGAVLAAVILFAPKFQIASIERWVDRYRVHRSYGGIVTVVCVMVCLLAASLAGAMIKGTCYPWAMSALGQERTYAVQ
jgi:Kef-type K+ transport system membrane component KefB